MQIMPAYESLLDLLMDQEYIHFSTINKQWICEGSPHGDQPWLPQNWETINKLYDHVYHLTYKAHPGIGGEALPLIDFIAKQQEINLAETNPVPFILCPYMYSDLNLTDINGHVAYSFNDDYKEDKGIFLSSLQEQVQIKFIDVSKLSWQRAAYLIHTAIAFIGCRSANWVLANGVGQKNIFTYEPNPARHKEGRFGHIFGNPYVWEESPRLGMHPGHASFLASRYINNLESIRRAHAFIAPDPR